MKKIAVLGSTGFVGQQALNVVRHLSHDLKICTLSAGSNIDLLINQVQEFHPDFVAIRNETKALEFKRRMPNIKVAANIEGLCEAACYPDVDIALFAMSGSDGLKPAIAAIEAGKKIALANKEILVCAGELIMQLARQKRIPIIPVDSEHSAIFQCLHHPKEMRRIILTSSGGPFCKFSYQKLSKVQLEQALIHPNYRMGAKITIDSSTLMNKGLEMIEARWLFDTQAIDVVIHPQQIIHSMVEYCDGSVLAQMSEPNMVLPIQYALTFPERKIGLLEPLDFERFNKLTFAKPNRKKFPCLALAEAALKQGRSYPCYLNAANEVLVHRFINRELGWMDISTKLEKILSSHIPVNMHTLDRIFAVDQEARAIAAKA